MALSRGVQPVYLHPVARFLCGALRIVLQYRRPKSSLQCASNDRGRESPGPHLSHCKQETHRDLRMRIPVGLGEMRVFSRGSSDFICGGQSHIRSPSKSDG
ncbi:hypothetical protein AVEN_198280-1 [Araneus ventricosus]|uniref:Uncharacterized protein n=1 Tax=Araneus ventricosus TaxID=182803 RepID=A0A4Y2PC51_ARAVE|nr:hypothetical protein AVEN_198280-1 [Araneus ventricosus]